MRSPVALAAIAVLTAAALSPHGGFAQDNPSAAQIMKSLTPTGTSGPTRGIRIGPNAPPATAQPPAAPAPAVNLSVQFATGSAELTPAALRVLDRLGQALSDPTLASYRFRIEGHTDTVGTREANLALSDRRAATVVAYLAGHFQVDRSRVQAVGMGEDGLLVPTADETPEPRNRRVQVVNIGQ